MSEPAVVKLHSAEELAAIAVDAVVQHYGVKADQIFSRRQAAPVVWARQVAVYLVLESTGVSQSAVAEHFKLDHTTVNYTVRRIEAKLAASPRVAAEIATIRLAIETAAPELKQRADGMAAQKRHALMRGGGLSPRSDVDEATAELELSLLIRELSRSLRLAVRLNPGAVLAGMKRAADDVIRKGLQ